MIEKEQCVSWVLYKQERSSTKSTPVLTALPMMFNELDGQCLLGLAAALAEDVMTASTIPPITGFRGEISCRGESIRF